MTAGRKTKYTEERINTILEALEQTGSDSIAIQAGGIGHDTFYKWLKEKPEFAERVKAARESHSSKGTQQVFNRIQAAEDWLDRLFKGEVTKTTRKVTSYPDGSERVEVTTEEIIPQHYHLERVLGRVQATEETDTGYVINIGLAAPSPTLDGDEEMAE